MIVYNFELSVLFFFLDHILWHETVRNQLSIIFSPDNINIIQINLFFLFSFGVILLAMYICHCCVSWGTLCKTEMQRLQLAKHWMF